MYVYRTTNLVNGKMYIGVSVNKKKYFRKTYLGSGVILKQAIKKYGRENFKKEILKEFDTEKDARDYERLLIEELDAINDPMYYNLVSGGYGGGVSGRVVSDETRKKISEGHKGKKVGKKQLMAMSKPILKYDLNGNFIKEYPSKAEAQRQIGKYIGELHKDKLKYRDGYLWMFKEDKSNIKIEPYSKIQKSINTGIGKTVAKLTDKEVINLIKDSELGLKNRELVEKYKISPSCVSEILNRKTYKWVWEKLKRE